MYRYSKEYNPINAIHVSAGYHPAPNKEDTITYILEERCIPQGEEHYPWDALSPKYDPNQFYDRDFLWPAPSEGVFLSIRSKHMLGKDYEPYTRILDIEVMPEEGEIPKELKDLLEEKGFEGKEVDPHPFVTSFKKLAKLNSKKE